MPVVEIKWWKGRSKEQKQKIIEGIFALFEKNGVKKGDLHVIIFDVEKENWGTKGKQASEL